MINVYDDGSVYIGEVSSSKRNGLGTHYLLDDYFVGYKVSGRFKDDKLNGMCKITTSTYIEEGMFVDGIKNGYFYKRYYDGRSALLNYVNGVKVFEDVYTYNNNNRESYFGYAKLSNNEYYLGDLDEGRPYGFGMVYLTEGNKIVKKLFSEVDNNGIIQSIDIDKSNNIKVYKKK